MSGIFTGALKIVQPPVNHGLPRLSLSLPGNIDVGLRAFCYLPESLLMANVAPHTSAQIAILRPICIFFMMYVHVNPGFDPAAHSGAMLYFGTLIVDFFGRVSVSALSLISGFLIASGAMHKRVVTQIWSRIRVLYVPMLVWSAIFIGLALGGSAVLGYATSASKAFDGLSFAQIVVEKIMFLYGTPISLALGFLRDLTVSSVLVILLLRIPGNAAIWAALAVVLGIVLFGHMEPIVYRSTILLFMLAGVAFYRVQGDLHIPRAIVLSAAFLFLALVVDEILGLSGTASSARSTLELSAFNVAKRSILTVLVLTLGGLLVTTRVGNWLRGIGDDVYLSFLCHTTVISIFWVAWSRLVGNEFHWAYPVFFLLSPALVMMLATVVGPLLSALPHPIQIGLRGKARDARSVGSN